jgi:hypothetical protein
MVEYPLDGRVAKERSLRYGRTVRSSDMLKPLIIASLAIAGASPVVAQTTPESATPAPKAKDPNRKICEKVEKIGSRLSVVRVCMTAQQWEEQRREHRDNVERVQKIVNQGPST